MKHIKTSKDFLNESIIETPSIPNTMNFWHGGNLDDYNDVISQKNGRYEFGAGLYITTHYETARKYAKGSRRLYLITVEKGVEINKAFIPTDKGIEFIENFIISSKRKEVLSRIQKYITDLGIKASVFNNIILNGKAIKPSNTRFLRQLFVDNGIDYEIVDNPFGWGEEMMVLYNIKKIVNVIHVKAGDKIVEYDLKNN